MELPNAITIYCIFFFFPTNTGQIGGLDIMEHSHFYLVKNT